MAIDIMLTETVIKHYGYRHNTNRNLYKTLWL